MIICNYLILIICNYLKSIICNYLMLFGVFGLFDLFECIQIIWIIGIIQVGDLLGPDQRTCGLRRQTFSSALQGRLPCSTPRVRRPSPPQQGGGPEFPVQMRSASDPVSPSSRGFAHRRGEGPPQRLLKGGSDKSVYQVSRDQPRVHELTVDIPQRTAVSVSPATEFWAVRDVHSSDSEHECVDMPCR